MGPPRHAMGGGGHVPPVPPWLSHWYRPPQNGLCILQKWHNLNIKRFSEFKISIRDTVLALLERCDAKKTTSER